MQTLRKKTSPLKYKNDTSRFMGEGVSFKAKLIGILEVSEARGDKMCQEALCDLKMAIRAAGEHKQRITITIALDGLRLRDEKTGDSLYHHPVHKISFIAQDMTDSRAFGYIFGSPDTGHRFFGIKTDKAASQVVIAMRDLFQVVFALKKKEIELAKQHLEKNSSPLFSDTSSSYSKLHIVPHVSIKSNIDTKAESSANDSKSGTAVADLVDLELELNSLQQGLNQMERITPMDPFGSKDDPFGDSFISYPAKPILPPPPSSGRDRSSRTSESSSIFSPKTPHTASACERKDFSFSQEDQAKGDWFVPASSSIFEDPSSLPSIEPSKDEKHEIKKQEIMSQFDVFTELDPLELKNPPKKALNELAQEFNTTATTTGTIVPNKSPEGKVFTIDPFGEDPFVKDDPFADSDFTKQDPFETEFSSFRFESMKGLEAVPPPPPPPLPPKKQTNDLLNVKPPPRPPYTEDFQKYEGGVEQEKSPPLPAPQRKTKFDIKPLVEGDYLTPIAFPEKNPGPTLPPPQRSTKSKPSEPLGSSLDITLSQLTLSGLNELAQKLNIPPGQLSNMTLVQLTSFLSNFMKEDQKQEEKDSFGECPAFQADFASNFGNATEATPYDRYAVFRELIQEEIKQTKIDSEPEEILEEKVEREVVNSSVDSEPAPSQETIDKYAALREIVEKKLRMEMEKEEERNEPEEDEEEEERKILNGDANEEEPETVDVINKKNEGDVLEEVEKPISEKTDIIEFSAKEDEIAPKNDVQAGNARPTSGSLSDVVSGSSPEVDITASNSDVGKKTEDVTGESWAIFDQTTILVDSSKEKQALQSEEGVSPWSSDSKEFPNGSPPDWKSKDSGSGTDQWPKKRRDQEGWWDTSAEPEAPYYSSNRRSTDSYDEEYYECYDKPRRRRQPGNWHQTAGGHSSSSRDVSPWEEEPRRPQKDQRESRGGYRHSREHSFDRHRDRRVTDSWDEDEDYEYEEENRRFHWPERHSASATTREHENDRWCEDWNEERRHRRRRGDPRERRCCPDWEQEDHDKGRYGSGRWSNPEHTKWRERYYSRESQESPWEDEYGNDSELSPYYLSTAKRSNWKQRPSSALEMDRKTGELKPRHFLGGSDGERDRRHKSNRRSRSRDSQYSEPSAHRHKIDPGPLSNRNVHRNKVHSHPKPLEPEKPPIEVATVPTMKETLKKISSSTLNRKKAKEVKGEETASTLPRKSSNRFNFDNETTDPLRSIRPLGVSPTSLLDRQRTPRYPPLKAKSLFEDDFSPGDKSDDHIGSIKEEEDDFGKRNLGYFGMKKVLCKNRSLADKGNLKKSESVNIFAREDDPFDDDFFCGEHAEVEEEDEEEEEEERGRRRGTELRWTEDFKN